MIIFFIDIINFLTNELNSLKKLNIF